MYDNAFGEQSATPVSSVHQGTHLVVQHRRKIHGGGNAPVTIGCHGKTFANESKGTVSGLQVETGCVDVKIDCRLLRVGSAIPTAKRHLALQQIHMQVVKGSHGIRQADFSREVFHPQTVQEKGADSRRKPHIDMAGHFQYTLRPSRFPALRTSSASFPGKDELIQVQQAGIEGEIAPESPVPEQIGQVVVYPALQGKVRGMYFPLQVFQFQERRRHGKVRPRHGQTLGETGSDTKEVPEGDVPHGNETVILLLFNVTVFPLKTDIRPQSPPQFHLLQRKNALQSRQIDMPLQASLQQRLSGVRDIKKEFERSPRQIERGFPEEETGGIRMTSGIVDLQVETDMPKGFGQFGMFEESIPDGESGMKSRATPSADFSLDRRLQSKVASALPPFQLFRPMTGKQGKQAFKAVVRGIQPQVHLPVRILHGKAARQIKLQIVDAQIIFSDMKRFSSPITGDKRLPGHIGAVYPRGVLCPV